MARQESPASFGHTSWLNTRGWRWFSFLKQTQMPPHSIIIAQEDITERIFEPVSPHRFDLEMAGVAEAGDKLRMLGKAFMAQEFNGLFDFGDLF
jgi:hypothetical protein